MSTEAPSGANPSSVPELWRGHVQSLIHTEGQDDDDKILPAFYFIRQKERDSYLPHLKLVAVDGKVLTEELSGYDFKSGDQSFVTNSRYSHYVVRITANTDGVSAYC